jgi:hypothetical protein
MLKRKTFQLRRSPKSTRVKTVTDSQVGSKKERKKEVRKQEESTPLSFLTRVKDAPGAEGFGGCATSQGRKTGQAPGRSLARAGSAKSRPEGI